MPNTDSLLTFSLAVRNLLSTNAVALGLKGVFFGDRNKIPFVPAACVEPVDKRRELAGAPRRTENTFQVYVLIYHALVDDTERTLTESLTRAEAVETLLHADPQLGGLVIHGLVRSLESGVAYKQSLFRATRLTFEGLTKTNLPLST